MNKSTGNLWDSAGEGAYARMSQAWQWLCEQRDNAPEGADVWDVRWQALSAGPEWLTDLTHQVLRGEYRLVPLQLQGKNENRKAVWGARDALVLKWTALSLQHLLPLHPACEHVKGHGGGRQSIMKLHGLLTQDACEHHDEKKTTDAPPQSHINDDAVQAAVNSLQYKWVCRTDIRGYYRNIDKQTLLSQVRQHVTSPVLRDLVDQYIHYTVEDGGTFHTPDKGISRGCPLSPLMGALHLYDMDAHFAKQANIHYARYMDDIIILAKSRWSLRRHTKRLMQGLSEYGFEAHPDKTFIGRTEKGFDWMGAWLTHEGVTDIAPRAKANHREKVRRLYERLARVPLWRRKRARQVVHAKVSTYRKRWNIWAGAATALLLHLPMSHAVTTINQAAVKGSIVASVAMPFAGQYAPSGPSDFKVFAYALRSGGGYGTDPWGACPANTWLWIGGKILSRDGVTPNLVACVHSDETSGYNKAGTSATATIPASAGWIGNKRVSPIGVNPLEGYRPFQAYITAAGTAPGPLPGGALFSEQGYETDGGSN
ncbi:reverse transcriptase domain-containing protein, partial [Enterobacter asburiae]|uniref:reverse transcriptase domain-containing protein n=1 Tax=Enterobacter asburiae TaxID=61645 RepID=UPI003F554EAD